VARLGAVLAGGQSRRFGSDKALALLHGRPLIAHAIARLAGHAGEVIVCGKDWGAWIPDRPEAGLGPLGGINAALHHAAAHGHSDVLTIPCDLPELPLAIVACLGAGGYLAEMPVVGLWPATLAPHLDAWLAASDDRSVRGWAAAAGVRSVRFGEELPNLNTPQALNDFASR
jgi:molybdopterin-guanine dinucleotide biosynthesis protein A